MSFHPIPSTPWVRQPESRKILRRRCWLLNPDSLTFSLSLAPSLSHFFFLSSSHCPSVSIFLFYLPFSLYNSLTHSALTDLNLVSGRLLSAAETRAVANLCLSLYIYIYIYKSVSPSIYLSFFLSLSLNYSLSQHQKDLILFTEGRLAASAAETTWQISIYLFIYLSIYWSESSGKLASAAETTWQIYLSIYLFLSISIDLNLQENSPILLEYLANLFPYLTFFLSNINLYLWLILPTFRDINLVSGRLASAAATIWQICAHKQTHQHNFFSLNHPEQ